MLERSKKTSEANRFVGDAQVFDETIFIDTNDKSTMDLLIQKMGGTIARFAKEFYVKGQSREELKQEIAILVITGTRNYVAETSKLSTFLVEHIHNKLITLIAKRHKLSLNATVIKTTNGKKRRKAKEEILFSEVENRTLDNRNSNRAYKPFTDAVSENNAMFPAVRTLDSIAKFEFNRGIDSILASRGFDPEMAKIIRSMVSDDMSLPDLRKQDFDKYCRVIFHLKRLTRHKKIRDLFGR